MEMVQRLKEIYSSYMQNLAEVYRKSKPMEGIFGWGNDPRKDPCHMRFYEETEQWVKEFLNDDQEQSAVFEAVRFMLLCPAEHRKESCYWFLFAAQGLTRGLIPLLTQQQCAQLWQAYDKVYPKRERMPAQKEVYKLLLKGAYGA